MRQDSMFQAELRKEKKAILALLTDALVSLQGTVLQTEGIKITLETGDISRATLHANGRCLHFGLPVPFHFIKPADLFTAEGRGEMLCLIDVELQVSEEMEVATHCSIGGYQWLASPVADRGTMEFPSALLSDCLLHHLTAHLVPGVGSTLTSQICLRDLCAQAVEDVAHNRLVHSQPNLYLNGSLFQVQSCGLRENTEELIIDVWLEMGLKISDHEMPFRVVQEPRFYWLDDTRPAASQAVEIEYSYEGLAVVLSQYLNGLEIGGKRIELAGSSITYDRRLEVRIEMVEPVRSMITLTCQPRLDQKRQLLHADHVTIDIDASSFLYRLSSPLIENVVTSQLRDFFPFYPVPFLQDMVTTLPDLRVGDNRLQLLNDLPTVQLTGMLFSEDRLRCTVVLQQAAESSVGPSYSGVEAVASY